jgi:peptide/nickel transport system substrate-binding protein
MMRRRSWGQILVAAVLATAATGFATAAAQDATTTTAGADDERVVMTVGIPQSLDSANVTVGVTVAAYEVWNLQFATLTDKAADDFSTIPALAESWDESNDGQTYTYHLRDGLLWSDGEPLTADDVVYTIDRANEEGWFNHTATTQNLTAEAIDDQTVEITSSVPDPKLPTMDIYIVPKHIYEEISADDLGSYEALDGVGSGPFHLTDYTRGQSWTMEANPNWWGGETYIDEVVFRPFANPDAMVTALQRGEIDAAHNIPAGAVPVLEDEPDIEVIEGQQGGFDELALNAGGGPVPGGHPALEDLAVRQAVNYAIDKEAIVDRVYDGLAEPATTMSPSPDPQWIPDIPEEDQYTFDPDRANELLDEAGYEDTDGDGVREMPGGGEPLNFRYAVRSESEIAQPVAELVTGWLSDVGIDTTTEQFNDTQLTPFIGRGEWDMFVWGWTPFVDPDPQLSYFQCDQTVQDADDPTNYYNDANWCSEEYDELYVEQNQELDHERRVELVHEMLTLFYEDASYVVLDYAPDLQAYRTDRFQGWVRQPADTGPVIFSNTSPSYALLEPVAAADGADDDDGGGTNTGLIIVIAVLGVLVIGGGAFALGRRGSADDRE